MHNDIEILLKKSKKISPKRHFDTQRKVWRPFSKGHVSYFVNGLNLKKTKHLSAYLGSLLSQFNGVTKINV